METQKENGKVNGEIIPAGNGALAASNIDDSVERQLARAEKQIAFRKGILRLIAGNINPEHILLYGDEGKETLWLDKVACNRILSWAGARLEMDSLIQEKRYQGVEGPYIDFEVWGTVITEGDGRAVRIMGNRATYDDFYAKRTRYICSHEGCKAQTVYGSGCPQHGQVRSIKEEYYLPLEEVDIPSIKQAAITNLWNKAVAGLGFTPTVQELRDAGLDLKGRKRVKFGSDKEPAAKEPATTQPQSTQAPSVPPTASKAAAKPSPTPGNAAAAPKQAPLPQPPKPPNTTGRQLQLGEGIVTEAYKNKTKKTDKTPGGKPYVKLIQNGHTFFCYHDKGIEVPEGEINILDLLVNSVGKFCEFVVETKGEFNYIEGARIIGGYAWDAATGKPVNRDREPGDEFIPW